MGCTLAPPGEYDRTVRVRRLCGLMSSYFDHLLILEHHDLVTLLRHTDKTRHRASTSMYSLTFCVRFLLPERHQWKSAVQAAAVMLRTPPRRRPVTGQPATLTSYIRRTILITPLSSASHLPAARADPAQTAVRTTSSYRGMDASL